MKVDAVPRNFSIELSEDEARLLLGLVMYCPKDGESYAYEVIEFAVEFTEVLKSLGVQARRIDVVQRQQETE